MHKLRSQWPPLVVQLLYVSLFIVISTLWVHRGKLARSNIRYVAAVNFLVVHGLCTYKEVTMEPSPESIEKWDYHMPWSDLLAKLIDDEMRYTYRYQFAEAIGLDPTNLSKIVNGHGRLGAPSKPKTLLKLVKGLILGEYPDHLPAIRSEAQLTAFLDAVARKFWRGEYGGARAFRDAGRLWIAESVVDAFSKQRELWPSGDEKQETVQEPVAVAPAGEYYITKEEADQLVQLCTYINLVVREILTRDQPPD